MALVDAVCAGCGQSFTFERARARARKWCSEACRVAAYRRANYAAVRARAIARYRADPPRVAPTERTCKVCGAVFLGRPNANVCSTQCRTRASNRSRRPLRAKSSGVSRG